MTDPPPLSVKVPLETMIVLTFPTVGIPSTSLTTNPQDKGLAESVPVYLLEIIPAILSYTPFYYLKLLYSELPLYYILGCPAI